MRDSDDDPAPSRKMAELAIATADGIVARECAEEVVKRDPGPAARLLLGRAQLVAGALDAARFSFTQTIEGSRQSPLLTARAHLGVGRVAAAHGDPAGAAANVMAGFTEFISFAGGEGRRPAEVDAEIALGRELIGLAVALGRDGDVGEEIEGLAARRPQAPCALLRALWLAARQTHGDSDVSDAEVETELQSELDGRDSRVAKLLLIERRLRRRYRDASARSEAIAELNQLVEELAGTQDVGESVELARIYFLLAAAHEDDPGSADHAEAAYRRGLKLRPGHAAAANRLASLTLARGDSEGALVEIERALRIDADHSLAWRNAARVLEASSPGPGLPGVVARLLDAANPGAGAAAGLVAPRLVAATAEVARGDVLAGMHTRGHRLKNLLGIIGSRARSARKLADGELAERLNALETDVTALYDEWTVYLRSMQAAGSLIEEVPVQALVGEVVGAVAEQFGVDIDSTVSSGLPDLRGDRMLLREALVNIVCNAVEACAGNGGRVAVIVRAVNSGGTPIIEIEIDDSGPGILRSDLSRVFAPGFTTKETGSGVGLAIAERVIAAHHGRILLDSEPGRGTRITVMLPSDLGGFAGLAAFSTEPPIGEV